MDSYSGSGTNQEIDQKGFVLPGYFPYLCLVFKLIATTVILLLSGWVVYTIKTTRRLHKPHNIFVANLLVSGMVAVLFLCVIPSIMIISFQLEVESFLGCFAVYFRLLSSNVNNISILIVAADKVVTITLPFKHKRVMTPCVVTAIICGAWLLAVIPTAFSIVMVDGLVEVPEYGTCLIEQMAIIEAVFLFVIPIILSSIITIILNVHLAIKAYQVHKQIDKETALSGRSDSITALRKKQHNIKHHRKPIITLLVIILGSVFIPLLIAPLHLLGKFLVDSHVFHQSMDFVIVPNVVFVVRFFHPLVYGLYFKEVREPMMKRLKRFASMNKYNSVVPQP